jgi:hypothetical protein
MTTDVLLVQLPRNSAVDRNFREDLPPSIADGRVVVEHFPEEDDGTIGPPAAGEIVLSVLSPEALRDRRDVEEAILNAPDGDEPLVIIVEAAEYLREDELAAVLDAANLSDRAVIVRIMADA